MPDYNDDTYFEQMQNFFNAANFLAAAMTYLKDNPLLQSPITADDVKPLVSGHFGTIPAQNLIYTQVNRLINKYHQQTLVLQGPGHGGAALLANAYLNNDLVKVDPKLTQSLAGLTRLYRKFAHPFGYASHPEPAIPGAIHPGGELGYVLMHGFGAVLGHKRLLTVCIIGDGEAETGPLQASWQLNRILTDQDGKVLPIININGLTMENQSFLAQQSDAQLKAYFQSLNYEPLIVTAQQADITLQKDLATAFDQAMTALHAGNWPVILLKTPKGMTGPKPVVGTIASHQLPVAPDDLAGLNQWLTSYRPDQLFTADGQPKQLTALLPPEDYHVTDNLYTNRKGLAVKVQDALETSQCVITQPGAQKASNMAALSTYFNKISQQNPKRDQFLLLSPDESHSNQIALKDHVIDNVLSEHLDEGLLEGFLQTGGSGLFVSYEAFLPIVSSMIAQHLKWLTQASRHAWYKDLNALNLIGTATVWEQYKNGFTHQNPELLNTLAAKNAELVRLYLPVDVNTTLVTINSLIKTHQKVNYVITPKQSTPQWFTLTESQALMAKGIEIVQWASDDTENPDLVLAAAGGAPFTEVLAASMILRQALPNLTIRVILVLDLLRLQHPRINPRGLTDNLYNKLFTIDRPIIFNFHGYPATVQGLLSYRRNTPEFINGYQEEGSVTTLFDLRVQNGIDRFNIVKEALLALSNTAQPLAPELFKQMNHKLEAHIQYILENGEDLPEIQNWQFTPFFSNEK
ncbi:phosphoketolase family protein [Agrilactobacillus yilanensis]|uniref:Phosphoketolase family protein n=1 Tax=Agrilactobacillus yilanensis TaxID=2485997 RepID=A0ABW4J972_9LACO|nr:phosphoketolase family protein [Agrilactobacillus yilanensis]